MGAVSALKIFLPREQDITLLAFKIFNSLSENPDSGPEITVNAWFA